MNNPIDKWMNDFDMVIRTEAYEALQELFASSRCLHQIQEPSAAEQAAWHAGLDEGRAQAALPVDDRDWREPTTNLQRLREAMTLLCRGNQPADELLTSWLDGTSDALQDFAATHGPSWAQGIGIIDAATLMADQPTEGPDHEMLDPQAAPAAVAVPDGAIKQAIDAMELALASHGITLMSNPPQDAWINRGASGKLRDAIAALEAVPVRSNGEDVPKTLTEQDAFCKFAEGKGLSLAGEIFDVAPPAFIYSSKETQLAWEAWQEARALLATATGLPAQAVATAPNWEAMRHSANEWADMATSGLQWLRNIVDGISDPKKALENMESNLLHCRAVNDAPEVQAAVRAALNASQAQADARDAVLAHLDGLLDDAAAHIYPSDLRKCQTGECTVTVASVRMGNRNELSVPLYSREQVAEAFDAAQAAAQGGE